MKLFLSICVSAAMFMAVEVKAQQQTWMKTYGEDSNNEWGDCARQTSDGGYIIAGAYGVGAGTYRIYLVKTDAWGNRKWTTLGPDNVGVPSTGEPGFCVRQTSDGGYIIVGAKANATGGDIYLMKADSVGLVSWTRSYDCMWGDYGYGVEETPDKGYIVAGISWDGSGDRVRILRTDSLGDSMWTKAYGGASRGQCIVPASDGGYIIVGKHVLDVLLLKISSSGDSLWARTFGTANRDIGFCCRLTSDGGYIIAGHTGADWWGDGDVYLIKTNGVGVVEWENVYGGDSLDTGFSVDQASDGGYIIAGRTHVSGAGHKDVYLIKTDASGNLVWQRTFGDTRDDEGCSVQRASDGGFIIAGRKANAITGFRDVYVIKTDSLGNVDITPPELFNLIMPEDSAIVGTARPTFVWESTNDAWSGLKNYTIYIGTPRYTGLDTSWTPGYDLLPDWHTWYVIASDSAGNEQHSTETFAVLIDTTAPVIDSVTQWPDTSFFFGPFPVKAKVTDNIGFDSVAFYYRIIADDDTGTWQSSRMSDIGGGWFEDTIPEQVASLFMQIDYYLKCADWAGNSDSTAVYTFTIYGNPVEESYTRAPTVFALMSPEPNPCFGNTVIRYQLPTKAKVYLSLYDMTGRLVKTLVNGEREPGCYKVSVEAKDLSTGVYFVKFEAGDYKEVKKLILIK